MIYLFDVIFVFFNVTVTVHTAGRNAEHEDEDKLKMTVFNVDKAGQDKAGQTHRNTGSNEQTRRKLTEQTGTKIHRIITNTQLNGIIIKLNKDRKMTK